jgi:hypothetical protein
MASTIIATGLTVGCSDLALLDDMMQTLLKRRRKTGAGG